MALLILGAFLYLFRVVMIVRLITAGIYCTILQGHEHKDPQLQLQTL